MVQTQDYLLQALQEAIRMEEEGREYYLAGAARTRCAQVRQALEFLAMSESRHIEKLNRIYESLGQDPGWTETIAAVDPPPLRPHLFAKPAAPPEAWVGMAEDFEAMSTVLRLEQEGAGYYQGLARDATNPLAKRFFLAVSEEERDHYNLIKDLIDFLETNICTVRAADEEGRDF
jgi:rubrerythrin